MRLPNTVLRSAAAWFIVCLPSIAAAQIVLPGTQPGDLIDGLAEQAVCRTCHGQFSAEHYEPWDTWSGSMMANAARDPMFWAAVDIANQDTPGVGEFCIRCHSPRAWLDGRSNLPDGSAFIGSPASEGGDFEGVDCNFCHRMYEGPTGTPLIGNGQYWVDPGVGSGWFNVPARGPFPDANDAPHAWVYSDYHKSSLMCAVCHDLGNPLVNLRDETGADTGILFPEQATYREWSQSSFATDGVECQSCHMPTATGRMCFFDYVPTRELPKHELAGANAWMLSVIEGEWGDTLGRTEPLQQSINLALDQLQNHSAELQVIAPSRRVAGDDVTVRTRVTNLTGHKLPTGYPEGRRMWMHVLVTDRAGTTIYESGAYDEATATLVADPDLKVWETIHGQHDGGGPGFHLVLNDRIFKDNRIPPAGFRPDKITMPVGATYPTLTDGSLANWDEDDYAFVVPIDAAGPLRVMAELFYQTTSRDYVEFLRDENVTGPDPQDPDPLAPSRGDKMYSYWQTYDQCPPILMEARTHRIWLRPAPVSEVVREGISVPVLAGLSRNPFRDRTEIAFSLPEAATPRVSIFDVLGRRVRDLTDGAARNAGTYRVEWDGRDASGRSAATGSYFIRLEVPGYAPQVTRVILMR